VRTTVSTKGQIIIPAEIRREDDIKSGQEFEIERLDRGQYLLKRTTRKRNAGLIKLLLSCPVKDWFQPLERTETTDDIKLPKFE
jgi:AbrB family looped-hinge helix DNA binding protein